MFVGIDVAKAALVVSIRPAHVRFVVANTIAGVQSLVEHRSLSVVSADVPEVELVHRNGAYYSDQPPVFAVILSGA